MRLTSSAGATLRKIMGKFCIFPEIFPFAHVEKKMRKLGKNQKNPEIFS